ncbi:hypothetical protein [Robinsoniella peoriensis]
MMNENSRDIRTIHEKRKFRFYFPDTGLEEFARQGTIVGGPDTEHHPLGHRHTYQILEKVYTEIKKGSSEGYMLRTDDAGTMKNIYMEAFDKDQAQVFVRNGEGKSQRVVISEKKTYDMLQDYMENLKEGTTVYAREEMLEYFETVLRKYKRRERA